MTISPKVASSPLQEPALLRGKLEIAVVLLMLGLGLALRFYNLTGLSLWHDEAYDLYIAHELSFVQTFSYYDPYGIHPPLFFVLMHLWMKYIGLSEVAVRLFSVLMGLATSGLVYLIARRWFNRRIAFTSLLLVTFSSLLFTWSQSGRPYAWFTLLVTFSMALAMYTAEKPLQNGRWLLLGLSQIILLYAHYLAFQVIFAQGLFFLLLLYKNWGGLLRFGLTSLLVAVSFLPWLDHFITQSRLGPAAYMTNRGPVQLLETLEAFGGWYISSPFEYLVALLFGALYLLGLVWLWRHQRSLALWLISWSLLPVFTSWLSSLLRPNFLVRYLSFCLPAFLILVAVGLWRIYSYRRMAFYGLLGLALSLNIIAVLNFQTNYRNQDWRGLVNYLVANQQSHDFILLANPFGYTQPVFDFYYIYNSDVPIKLERHFPGNEATPLPERVAGWFKEPERVWLVSWYDNNTALIEQELKPAIPVNFKLSYYQEYRATEAVQGTIALSLYVRT